MTTQLLSKVTKIGGAIAIALSFSLAACNAEPDLNNVDSQADTPSEQAAVPADAEVGGDNATDDLGSLMGETVTISTKVTEVLSPNLFTAIDEESMRGEEMLVVHNLPSPQVDDNVEVTGDVMELDPAAVDEAYSITLDQDVVDAYTGKPYIAAKGVEKVD
ncbi:MAG: hypothetical protein WA947_15635 [Phormidesmis sp.]